MNYQQLRKKGIRSKRSIITEMLFYAFDINDIMEIAECNRQAVHDAIHRLQGEVYFYGIENNKFKRIKVKGFRNAMFSDNENHYGRTGNKYKLSELSPMERALFNHEEHNELKTF